MGAKIEIKKGDQFGRWLVIEPDVYDPNSKAAKPQKKHLCECQCEKHTLRYKTASQLISGQSKSCGCLRAKELAIRNANNSSVKVGNRYGKLIVIQDLGMRKQVSRDKNERWSLCQCDCGSRPIEVKNNMLQNGWKNSCGCLQSKGEAIIEKILKDNDIQYIKEYGFEDLIGNKGGKLRFDFAIFYNNQLSLLIEVDGKQHYTGPEATWTQTHSLEEIIRYDKLKNEYCLTHNIPLKRIPYFLLGIVNKETLLEDNKFDVSKERWRIERNEEVRGDAWQ